MTIDQLKAFCITDNTGRHHIDAPFSQQDWTFATNGHICIRVPRLAEVGEVQGAPDCAMLFDPKSFEDPARAWVETPEPDIEIERCRYCKGAGYLMDCPTCHDPDFDDNYDCHRCNDALSIPCSKDAKCAELCEFCDGKGEARTGYNLIPGPKGEAKLSAMYIELIRALPNSKIGLLGNESDSERRAGKDTNLPVCFRFDGGDGLLMPVRKY